MSIIASDNRRVIVGLGSTGLSVARHLARGGHTFSVADSRTQPPNVEAFRREFPDADLVLGPFAYEQFVGASELIVNPGIPLSTPALVAAKAAGAVLTGDIDYFHRAAQAPIVAITGSNGKSTVTTLLGEMAEAAGVQVAVGGNLGTPALDLLDDAVELYVLELSSFQLERCANLGAEVATVLNISADHLDHHGSMVAYHQAKHRIFQGCKKAVINRDEPLSNPLVPEEVEKWYFRQGGSDFRCFGLEQHDGETWIALAREPLMPAAQLNIAGGHNTANALAALALGAAAGLELPAMLSTLKSFTGLSHRCEFVAERGRVGYYNDSKGTNVGAAVAAIKGLADKGRVVLIAGGQAKGASFEPLAECLMAQGRGAVLIGEAAADIETAIAGRLPVSLQSSMADAVAAAADMAEEGDVVLLSPACASFDMFAGYSDRGTQFCQAVENLPVESPGLENQGGSSS